MALINRKYIRQDRSLKIVYSGKKLGNMQSHYSNPEKSKQNITSLLNSLGPNLPLLEINAMGGKTIKVVDKKIIGSATHSIKCDGLIINQKHVALGLYAADCIPMVIATDKKPCFGLIHVGTTGAVLGIHTDSIKRFCKEYKILPKDLIIYFGPHIKKKSYKFNSIESKNLDPSKWQKYITFSGTSYHLDLAGYVLNDLLNLGVKKSCISVSLVDTGKNKDYFSHRRSSMAGEPEGRNGFMCALLSKV